MKNLFTLLIMILTFQVSFGHSSILSFETNRIEGFSNGKYGFITNYPTVSTDSATIITADSAILYGSVNAYGFNVTVTFEWGLTTSYGNTVTASQSPVSGSGIHIVSCKISNMNTSTNYYYRVVAFYNSTSVSGTDLYFTSPSIAPSASTDTFSSVTAISAVLNATVNAKNDFTDAWFEWGTTQAYGNVAYADQNPIIGNNNTSVTATLTNLESYTYYHFRIVAVNSADTAFGRDITFETTGLPPDVTTLSATSIDGFNAVLNARIITNDEEDNDFDADDTNQVYFEWGTSATYNHVIYADQHPLVGPMDTTVTAGLENLYPNTTYHYRIVGINTIDTAYGLDETFTTNIVPPAATTNAASNVSLSEAIFHADVNANNSNTMVYFQWDTSLAYNFTNVATNNPINGLGDSAISLSITGLSSHTTYHYRVIAINAADTTFGSDQFFTTYSLAPLATTDSATVVTVSEATLNAIVNANNEYTEVTFEWGLTSTYGNIFTADNSPINGSSDEYISYQFQQLNPNTTYHYRVVAENATGIAQGSDVTFTTIMIPPTVYTDSASSVLSNSADLKCHVNANNVLCTVGFDWGTSLAYGNTVYALQNPLSGIGNTNIQYSLTGLNPNTVYHYRAKVIYGMDTIYGLDFQFHTLAIAAIAITTPATAVTRNSAVMHAEVNPNNNPTYVTFEWGITPSYGNVVIASLCPLNGMMFSAVMHGLSNLVPNSTYHYRIVARNSVDTTYGNNETFTTPAFDLSSPVTITTKEVVITSNSTAISGGEFEQISSYPILEKGICWSLKPEADISLSTKTNEGSGYGSFTSILTNLNTKSTYYVRSYAITEMGVVYGNEAVLSSIRSNSIAQSDVKDLVKIYSFSKKACVKISDYNDATTATIEIYNTIGKSIATSTVTSDLNVIDLSMATRGYYVVRVNHNNQTLTQKIFIE